MRKYDENGEKQRNGMISVLEMLREKYTTPMNAGLWIVGIDHGVHWHSV